MSADCSMLIISLNDEDFQLSIFFHLNDSDFSNEQAGRSTDESSIKQICLFVFLS